MGEEKTTPTFLPVFCWDVKTRRSVTLSVCCFFFSNLFSFALLLESFPVANSLNTFGGLGRLPLLPPASLQLAQIKTQLALHQLNALAATNAATAVPSPAQTLLNLLKVSMSHPMYNPGGGSFSGSQRSMVSNQYGLGGQPGMDMGGSRLGPGAGSMSGASPGMMSSMRPQQMGFPLGQRPPQMSQDMESSIDMHIRGAREEVRLLSQIMPQQPKPADPRLYKDSREEVGGFPGQRGSGRIDEPSSPDWSSYQPPSSKNFTSSGLDRSSSSSSIFQTLGFGSGGPGAGRGGVESQTGPRSVHSERPPVRYTSESASSILASFGLSNEDLELLSHYPDDQLTPDNLPFILRDIRIRKAKRSLPDTDDRSPRDHRGQEPRQSKVIDYGHSSKYGYAEEGSDSYARDPLPKQLPKYEREGVGSGSSFGGTEMTRRTQASPAAPISAKPAPMDHRNVLASPELKAAQPTSLPGRDPVPKSVPPAPSRPVAMPPTHTVGSRAGMMVLGDASGGPKPTTWPPAFPPPGNPSSMKRLPTPTMMNDYSAATPRIFPHTCSLCNVECVQIKVSIYHSFSALFKN